MSSNKLRRWEFSLMVGLACAILVGVWADGQQTQLANQVIRLHVIAHSDSAADQALKLAVRDAILAQSDALFPSATAVEEAETALEAALPTLTQVGQAVVEDAGFDYGVTATLADDVWFPTKDYGDFSLPAGDYTALQVTLGDGQGENWWCVVFPPLCMASVTEETVTTLAVQGFDDDEIALVMGTEDGYVLKFKVVELWGELKQWAEGQ